MGLVVLARSGRARLLDVRPVPNVLLRTSAFHPRHQRHHHYQSTRRIKLALPGPAFWPPLLWRLPPGSRTLFSRAAWTKQSKRPRRPVLAPILMAAALTVYSLYPVDDFRRLRSHAAAAAVSQSRAVEDGMDGSENQKGVWWAFASRFDILSKVTDSDWDAAKVVDYILPEWSKMVPGYLRKLQRELSMAPGSLADEIWTEASDPSIHPEIQFAASVRVSGDLCDEEKTFLSRRKALTTLGLSKYLGLDPRDVHPDDVPIIGVCGSGGGVRALAAGAGSLSAAAEDGLFDCVTYMVGVSGSCWLQALFFSSVSSCDFVRLLDHIKARVQVHIAFPPAAFNLLVSAPTSKPLLSGVVEKLKGNPAADFGLVDVYGLLLAARFLVPKGDLGVDDRDFKLSNQRDRLRFGQYPMPIYTAVRHEIPEMDAESPADVPSVTEAEKARAKAEAWFQWFEISPYEFFCEELGAGIPTWAMGRRFRNGSDVPLEETGLHLPEIRMSLLLGMFGSAFCATLSHYYNEVRPLVRRLSGLSAVDELISGHNEDLSKVHPIDPTSLPNPIYGMDAGSLPQTVPPALLKSETIQLMDAGMSNNLPVYPLLRPGRDVEVIIAFDASADIKTGNWLSVADGYARQRGVKGWPVGIGWPKETSPPQKTAEELQEAQAESTAEAERKLEEAQVEQYMQRLGNNSTDKPTGGNDGSRVEKIGSNSDDGKKTRPANELGFCTVWVGTTQERSTEPPPPLKYSGEEGDDEHDEWGHWRLREPDAGLTVVYVPYLANDKVPGVNPETSEYMSTWNFVYTPAQVDEAVALARANYAEGKGQIRATVRAVYERKKKLREQRELQRRREQYRRLVSLGIVGKLGEGDHFS